MAQRLNPFSAAADALNGPESLRKRKERIDEMTEEPKRDDKSRKAEPDPKRDIHEEKELMKTTPRLQEYRLRKGIGGDSPAEIRLLELQERRLKSYKKGTKYVPKTGIAKLHKGEAVLTVKQAKKYRKGQKVKAAASALGSGKHKKPAKKGVAPATRIVVRTGTGGRGRIVEGGQAALETRELQEKRELRKTVPRLKAYREKHGIKNPTAAEKRLQQLIKEQTVDFSKEVDFE